MPVGQVGAARGPQHVVRGDRHRHTAGGTVTSQASVCHGQGRRPGPASPSGQRVGGQLHQGAVTLERPQRLASDHVSVKLLYVLERHTDEAVFPKHEQKVKWKMVQVEETAKCRCGCSVTGPAGTSRPSLPAPPRGARPRAPGLAWAGAGGAAGGGGSLVGFRGRIAAVQETLAPVVLSSTEGATRHVVPYGAG